MANTSETKIVSSISDLKDIFKHKDDRKGIKPKFEMPKIGGDGKTIVIVDSDDGNGNVGPIRIVKNEKMKGGEAPFMDVMEHGDESTIYQMGLGESLLIQFDAMCNDNKWPLTDLHGKIVTIKASPYAKFKCNSCYGKGCEDCDNTGKSKVFSLTARHDLMNPTKVASKGPADNF